MERPPKPPGGAVIDFDRVFGALIDPDTPLNDDDLGALNALNLEARGKLREAFERLDTAARFSVLVRLIEVAAEQVTLDYSSICLDCLADPDASVRALAVSGLGEVIDRQALLRLLQVVREDPDELVRAEATDALRSWVLRAEFGRLRNQDRADLIEALRELAEDSGEAASVRGNAVESLGALSEEWVQELIHESFATDDQTLRLGALRAMGWSADPYWLPTVLDSMEVLDDEERSAAAFAAGEIENEDAVPSLGDLLEDESEEVVLTAVAALGQIGGRLALEALDRVRTHPDAEIRDGALAAREEAALLDDPLHVPQPKR